jgi:soluble P-type ATPase
MCAFPAQVTKSAGVMAAESLEGLSALAQDGSKSVAGVVKVAAVVGDMVLNDALAGVEAVGGEEAASSLRAASDVVLNEISEVGELAVTNLASTTQLAVSSIDATTGAVMSGIKDNVQLIDTMIDTVVSTASRGNSFTDSFTDDPPAAEERRAVSGTAGRAAPASPSRPVACGTGGASGAGVARTPGPPPGPPPPPPLRSFEAWLEEYGSGSMMMQTLENMRDSCQHAVQFKLQRLAPSQRATLERALSGVEALVSEAALSEAPPRAPLISPPGQGKERGAVVSGPPTDRLAQYASAGAQAEAARACRAARGMGAAAASALTRGVSPGLRPVAPPVGAAPIGAPPVGAPPVGGPPVGASPPPLRASGSASGSASSSASSSTSGSSVAERAVVAQKGVAMLRALCTQCLAKVCEAALTALHAYAARCRLEADKPSQPEPGASLEGEPLVHALDWPFVSELERARWKALCLRAAAHRLTAILTTTAAEFAEAAGAIRRSLPAGGASPGAHGGASPGAHGGASPGAHGGASREASPGHDATPAEPLDPALVELKQQVRALCTTIQLDASAAVAMVQEAAQLCAPVLSYVALGDVCGAE